MMTKLRGVARRISREFLPGNFLPKPADVMLVSYPRSGNTWSRFLVSGFLTDPESVHFGNLNQHVPDLYEVGPRRLNRTAGGLRVIKSHEPFHPGYGRVVYLVRDPRDVLLSYFRLHKKLSGTKDLELFFVKFLEGSIDPFGSWRQHVGGWLGARAGDEDFLLVRYEDLLSDTAAVLKNEVLPFLGITADDERVLDVIEKTSASRMRRLEASAETLTSRRPTTLGRASAGYWGHELPAAIAGKIEASWGETMARLGYGIES